MLIEKLQQYRDAKQMVAFSKWADGKGLLIGYVLEVTDSEVRFAEIDQLGQPDGEIELQLKSIYRLGDSPDYIERLKLFGQITPPITKSKGQVTKSKKGIAKRLKKAEISGECVSLMLPADLWTEFPRLAVRGALL